MAFLINKVGFFTIERLKYCQMYLHLIPRD